MISSTLFILMFKAILFNSYKELEKSKLSKQDKKIVKLISIFLLSFSLCTPYLPDYSLPPLPFSETLPIYNEQCSKQSQQYDMLYFFQCNVEIKQPQFYNPQESHIIPYLSFMKKKQIKPDIIIDYQNFDLFFELYKEYDFTLKIHIQNAEDIWMVRQKMKGLGSGVVQGDWSWVSLIHQLEGLFRLVNENDEVSVSMLMQRQIVKNKREWDELTNLGRQLGLFEFRFGKLHFIDEKVLDTVRNVRFFQ